MFMGGGCERENIGILPLSKQVFHFIIGIVNVYFFQ